MHNKLIVPLIFLEVSKFILHSKSLFITKNVMVNYRKVQLIWRGNNGTYHPCRTTNKWLQENNVTVIDVRSGLNNPDAGEAAYNEAHIPKAYYLHLERDLSGEVSEHGGNHPLPDAETLAATLREMGVAFEKPIV